MSAVEQVISVMPEPKRTYARRMWAIWTGNRDRIIIPEVPEDITERAKEDVRWELAQYDTRTGERI